MEPHILKRSRMENIPLSKLQLLSITLFFSGVVRLLIDGPSKHQVLTNVRKSGNITLTLSDARDFNKVLEGGKFSLVDSKGHVLKT